MAECFSAQNNLILSGQYLNTLDTDSFSQMLKNPSSCYKFYWLLSIVTLITEDTEQTTFDAVIDEMIAAAWYPVREYHIHLSGYCTGDIRDGLERCVERLAALSSLASDASRSAVKAGIRTFSRELETYKKQLTLMVPYRALAGFFKNHDCEPNWNRRQDLVGTIRKLHERVALPYVLGDSPGLKREIVFTDSWSRMIRDNACAIVGWIQYELLRWLQMVNPEVPELVYKLSPLTMKTRKLGAVRKLWDGILQVTAVDDIYTGRSLNREKYEIDHFVPWSFVMDDEVWNLMPMDASLNSSKSNNLPVWDSFFPRYAQNQYILFRNIFDHTAIMKLFKKCYKDNLHSIWAWKELYNADKQEYDFCQCLAKNMRPVYESALRQGYSLWQYSGSQASIVV